MNTTFFEEFLIFTQLQTGIFIVLLLALFTLLGFLKKKKVLNLSGHLFLATFLGLGLGLAILFTAGMPEAPLSVTWVYETHTWYGLIADGFMSLLRMLVLPLVLVSIIRVIVNMEGGTNLGKLVSRGVGLLILTTLIGATIGIIFSHIFGLGTGVELVYGTEEVREVTSLVSTIFNMIPDNPFAALSNGAIIPTIVFATFIGLGVRMQVVKDTQIVQPFINFIEAVYAIIMNMAQLVINWLPYAIIALLANTIATGGLQVFADVALFTGIFLLSVFTMFGVHLVILMLSGLSPIKYIHHVGKALILAFTSRSSLGTLPVSIEALTKNAGLNPGTATFITSLGANGGMNGSAGIFSAMITIMIANMAGHPVDVTFIVMLLIVIAFSSFGVAGVPGGVMLAISIPLTALGLGEYFALTAVVFAIDPILDMFRTFINVSGALTTSLVVGKSLNEIDLEVYHKGK